MAGAAAQIEALVAPAVAACGCELWGIEYISQGRHTTLRVYIDHAKGIGVEQCADVSRQLAAVTDVDDPITGEVSYTHLLSHQTVLEPVCRLLLEKKILDFVDHVIRS